MNPKVSIIIPAFNSEDFIVRCIESARAQTYQNIEIIIVDDGSTDQTGEKCKCIEKDDERIRYIFKKNGGVSSARNVGIKCAIGEYVFFLDSDDTISEEAIESLVRKQNQKSELIGVRAMF